MTIDFPHRESLSCDPLLIALVQMMAGGKVPRLNFLKLRRLTGTLFIRIGTSGPEAAA